MPICARCGADNSTCHCPKSTGFLAQIGAAVLVSAAVLGVLWLLSLLLIHMGMNAMGRQHVEGFAAYRLGLQGILPALAMAHACLAQHIPLALTGTFSTMDTATRLTGGLWLPITLFSLLPALLLWLGGRALAAWTRPASAGSAIRLLLCYAVAYAALLTLGAAGTAVPLHTLLAGMPVSGDAGLILQIFTGEGSTLAASLVPVRLYAAGLGLLWPLLFGGLGIAAAWWAHARRTGGSLAGRGLGWLHALMVSGRMLVIGLLLGALGAALALKGAPALKIALAPALGSHAVGLMSLSSLRYIQDIPILTEGGSLQSQTLVNLWQGVVKTEAGVATRTALPAWAWTLVLLPLLLHLAGGFCLARRDRDAGHVPHPLWLAVRYALAATGWLALLVWVSTGSVGIVFTLISSQQSLDGVPTTQTIMAALLPVLPFLLGGAAGLSLLGSLFGAGLGTGKPATPTAD